MEGSSRVLPLLSPPLPLFPLPYCCQSFRRGTDPGGNFQGSSPPLPSFSFLFLIVARVLGGALILEGSSRVLSLLSPPPPPPLSSCNLIVARVLGGALTLDFLSVCPRRIPLQLLINKFYSCLVTNSPVA